MDEFYYKMHEGHCFDFTDRGAARLPLSNWRSSEATGMTGHLGCEEERAKPSELEDGIVKVVETRR